MLTRFLGCFAACVGVAGVAAAQQPAAPLPKTSLPAMPAGVPAARPAPAVSATPAPAVYAPAPAPTPNYSSALAGPSPATLGVPAAACGPAGCPPAGGAMCDCLCGPPGRCWVSAEYLLWTATDQRLPALVSTSPDGTARDAAGVLGRPGTRVLYGNQRANDDWRSGFRLRAGTWLDDCQKFGVEGDFFFLGTDRDDYRAGSPGSPILARPFFNVLQNAPDSQLVALPDSQLVGFPGVLSGGVSVDSKSDLIGGGFNVLCNLCCDPCGRLDFTAGYRYLNLRDEVVIREDLTALAGSNVAAGTRFLITDRFRTDNDFHGGTLGLNYERRFGHFFLGVRPSVALGVVHTTVTVDGSTVIVPPTGAAQTFPGGLLTQTTNIGRYTDDDFAVVPEIGVRLGAQVTDGLRAYVSYNYIYMSNVARAGDQIDPRVNTNLIAPPQPLNGGPAFPAFNLRRTGYSVQGIGFGLEYRF